MMAHTSVYRKPTHTDRYLDFDSHHPSMHKASVVKVLFNRARDHSSCAVTLHNENQRIKSVLRMNNYPRSFVDRVYRTSPHPKPSRDDFPGNSDVIPHIKVLSKAINSLGPRTHICVIYVNYECSALRIYVKSQLTCAHLAQTLLCGTISPQAASLSILLTYHSLYNRKLSLFGTLLTSRARRVAAARRGPLQR